MANTYNIGNVSTSPFRIDSDVYSLNTVSWYIYKGTGLAGKGSGPTWNDQVKKLVLGGQVYSITAELSVIKQHLGQEVLNYVQSHAGISPVPYSPPVPAPVTSPSPAPVNQITSPSPIALAAGASLLSLLLGMKTSAGKSLTTTGGGIMGTSWVADLMASGYKVISGPVGKKLLGYTAVGGAIALGSGLVGQLFQGPSGEKAVGITGRRRINPTNAKALRRSVRRLNSYSNLNKSIEKSLRKLAPKHTRRQSYSGGVITAQEARRALST